MTNSNGTTVSNTSKTFTSEIQIGMSQGIAVVALNIFLSIFGTFGNFAIIIIIFTKRHRLNRTPSNRLLMSLAFADLVVTTTAQPLYSALIYQKIFANQCVKVLEQVYMVSTPFSACSSALHLATVSIDRAISATKPHRYVVIMKRWYKVMLAACWLVASLYGCLLLPVPAVKSAMLLTLSLCFLVMLFSYGMILWKVKTSIATAPVSTTNERDKLIEKRVSGTIAIVIVLFAVCWFPFLGYNLSKPQASLYCTFDSNLVWIRTLVLSNSSMNFIVYTLRIRQFRSEFKKIVNKILCRATDAKLCCCSAPTNDEVSELPGNTASKSHVHDRTQDTTNS